MEYDNGKFVIYYDYRFFKHNTHSHHTHTHTQLRVHVYIVASSLKKICQGNCEKRENLSPFRMASEPNNMMCECDVLIEITFRMEMSFEFTSL